MANKVKKFQFRHFDTIIDRIKAYKNLRYDIDVAELLGMTQSAFAERKRRNSIPYEEVMSFCEREGIPYGWIIDGRGPDPQTGDFTKISVFAMAGAGDGREVENLEPIDSIVLPSGYSFPSLLAIKVRGESMEPTIYDGAIVGVDREDRNIVNGKVYAVWVPYEGAVIKRVFVDHEKLILKSDNVRFPDFSIPFGDIRDRENIIIGRVAWVVQKI
jgi:hypothetical protein